MYRLLLRHDYMRVYGGGLHGRQYFHNTGYAVAGRALGSSTYHVPFTVILFFRPATCGMSFTFDHSLKTLATSDRKPRKINSFACLPPAHSHTAASHSKYPTHAEHCTPVGALTCLAVRECRLSPCAKLLRFPDQHESRMCYY